MKLRTDDEVIVISGKDKGKTGKILRVDPQARPGLRRGHQHRQAPHSARTPRAPNAQVGVIETRGLRCTSPTWRCWTPRTSKPTRVGTRRTEEGSRMRVTKRSGTEID